MPQVSEIRRFHVQARHVEAHHARVLMERSCRSGCGCLCRGSACGERRAGDECCGPRARQRP